jgi:hypothetical protein
MLAVYELQAMKISELKILNLRERFVVHFSAEETRVKHKFIDAHE